MNLAVLDILIKQIKRHEGLRLKSYYCTEGKLTIGYGHTGDDVKKGMKITAEHAEKLLAQDIEVAYKDAKRFAWFELLNAPRKAVIVNMLFNLGFPRFSGFKQFQKAIEAQDFIQAGNEMMDSRWAHQVGDGWGKRMDRAEELALIMQKGAV